MGVDIQQKLIKFVMKECYISEILEYIPVEDMVNWLNGHYTATVRDGEIILLEKKTH